MSKDKRGGRRAGAGRKPIENPKLPYSTKLDQSVLEYLKSRTNQAATIEAEIMRSKGYRNWKNNSK